MSRSVDLLSVRDQAIGVAKNLGVDNAEAFVASNDVLTIRLVNNAVFEAKMVRDIGLGFGSTSNLSKMALQKTVETAALLARKRRLPFKLDFPQKAKPTRINDIYDDELAKLPIEEAVELAYDMTETALSYDARIVDNAGVLNIIKHDVAVLNTNGLEVSERGTVFEISLISTAKAGINLSEGGDSAAGRRFHQLNPKDVALSAAKMAVDGLGANSIEEGTYPVILDPGISWDLASSLMYLTSPYWTKRYYPLLIGKIGQKVVSDRLTVIDDPTLPGGYRSYSMDGEGTPARKTTIIEGGVLKSFVYDSFYGAMEGKESTGNAVRDPLFSLMAGLSTIPGKSYQVEPLPLALNLTIQPGDWKKEEIIEDTKDGLLAKRIYYSRITDPTKGDWTAVLRMGLYRVRNGVVVGAVQKSRVIGNVIEALKSVDAIADDLTIAGHWGDYYCVPTLRTELRVVPVK